MPTPVAQNPSRRAFGSSCASATAVDSSIVKCGATIRRHGDVPTTGAIRRPYATFRTPRRPDEAIAAGAAATPPAPITPMKANCDPPVNITRLSTQVCQMSSPDATANAPNEMP